MGFLDRFRGGPPTDPETAERDAARRERTVQNLQRGGLPINAMERLREARARQGTDQHFFTSNLSVNEFVLTHDAGSDFGAGGKSMFAGLQARRNLKLVKTRVFGNGNVLGCYEPTGA